MGTDDPHINIQFVQLVEKYPCLWHNTLRSYSKRDITENAWKAVAHAINDSVRNCRDRWRNIRSAFARVRRRNSNGESINHKYYLSEYLNFVVPFTLTKSRPGGDFFDINDSENPNQFKDEDNIEIPEYDEELSNTSLDNASLADVSHTVKPPQQQVVEWKNMNSPKKRKLEQTTDPVENAFLELVENEKERTSENADMLFFQSLLPDIEKMTDKQKRKFKKNILELIDDVLEEGSSELSHSRTYVNSLNDPSKPSTSSVKYDYGAESSEN